MPHGNERHGAYSGKRKPDPEYGVWIGILYRCNNEKCWAYKYYGGRGIKVCDRWLDYRTFLADMGSRPADDMQIDRIDNDGGYEPGNCRWVTAKENSNNRGNSIRLDGMTVDQVAEALGMTYSGVYARIVRGWPIEKIIAAERDCHRSSSVLVELNGDVFNATALAKMAGISLSAMCSRIKNGVTGEELIKPQAKAKGSSNGSAKLNNELVAEILLSKESAPAIAKRLSVSSTLIYSIRKRRIWAHVEV